MSGRTWRRWDRLGVATDRIDYGGHQQWRVYVQDPDRQNLWRDTDLFITTSRHERPEWRYGVHISGGDPSGGALTVARKRLISDAMTVTARTLVRLERDRAQTALDAAVIAWRENPTEETKAANLAAAERYMHWSQRVIAFECIDQQNGAA